MLQQTGTRGRRFSIPRSRRLVIDIMRLREKVPTVAHDRIVDLQVVATARQNSATRISWPVLFIKAFSLVAMKYPVLRQTFMRWPWAHLYEHPHSIGTLATHRDVKGESWLFWSRFHEPEKCTLSRLQAFLDRCQSEPVQKIFERQWWFSAFPGWVRRIIWWSMLNVSGFGRARRVGTFLLTTIGSRGAEIQHPPGFLTGNITFGPFDDQGRCRVTLAYDHRLFDGRMCADILSHLEQTLNGVIAEELSAMSTAQAPHWRAA